MYYNYTNISRIDYTMNDDMLENAGIELSA